MKRVIQKGNIIMFSMSNLFERLIDPETMKSVAYTAMKARGKGAYYREYYSNNQVPPELIRLREALIMGEAIPPCKRNPKIIYEASADKYREILPPTDDEHIVHHLICNAFLPVLTRGMYEYSVASIPGRGGFYGKKHMERWIHSFDSPMYVLKLDIHHFFQSINRSILYYKLIRHSRDKRFNSILVKVLWHDCPELLDGVTPSKNTGIPIGFYTSQWFANYYLQDFDHFIKEDLHVEYYMRYMDDMVLISPDIDKLKESLSDISDYLSNIRLQLKDSKTQLFMFSYTYNDKEYGNFIDFMGFTFHCNRTCLRKSTLKRIRRKCINIIKRKRQHKSISWYASTQTLSVLGRLTDTDTYAYSKKYLLKNSDKYKLRRIVSKHSKILNKKVI